MFFHIALLTLQLYFVIIEKDFTEVSLFFLFPPSACRFNLFDDHQFYALPSFFNFLSLSFKSTLFTERLDGASSISVPAAVADELQTFPIPAYADAAPGALSSCPGFQ
mgnify:CR=1